MGSTRLSHVWGIFCFRLIYLKYPTTVKLPSSTRIAHDIFVVFLRYFHALEIEWGMGRANEVKGNGKVTAGST